MPRDQDENMLLIWDLRYSLWVGFSSEYKKIILMSVKYFWAKNLKVRLLSRFRFFLCFIFAHQPSDTYPDILDSW